MNLLAHAHLSFNNPDILLGNMISDYVKGKKQYDYPAEIQKGIKLHRAIDAFTDEHSATKEIKKFFAPVYRLYAGAFADIVYDYFLANDRNNFSSEKELFDFTQKTYALLEQNKKWMDPVFAGMFPYLKSQNWLYNYREDWGIEKSLGGLQRRAIYIESTKEAFEIFLANKPAIQILYDTFYPDVKNFAKDFMTKQNP